MNKLSIKSNSTRENKKKKYKINFFYLEINLSNNWIWKFTDCIVKYNVPDNTERDPKILYSSRL